MIYKKNVVSTLVMACLVFLLMGGFMFLAPAETNAAVNSVKIYYGSTAVDITDGTPFSGSGGGTATWDSSTNTLRLNDFVHTVTGSGSVSSAALMIDAPSETVTIELFGASTFSANTDFNSCVDALGKIIIKGTGSLSITSQTEKENIGKPALIVHGSLIVTSGTLSCKGGDAVGANITSCEGTGIEVNGDFEVAGGNVSATGGSADNANQTGINVIGGSALSVINGNFTITGGVLIMTSGQSGPATSIMASGLNKSGTGVMSYIGGRVYLNGLFRFGAVENLENVDCTTTANNDGKIVGTDTDMVYSAANENVWTACGDGETTGLSAGIYLVKYTAMSAPTVSVTIEAYTEPATPPAPTPAPPAPTPNPAPPPTPIAEVPKTGDGTIMVAPTLIMITAISTLAVIVYCKRRVKEK